jgi:Activator of Hsp90 ATPase homolog 1-like protein
METNGDKWTLILVRELRHSPEKVWQALTDPAHLREWAPFKADGSLGMLGATGKLTTVGASAPRAAIVLGALTLWLFSFCIPIGSFLTLRIESGAPLRVICARIGISS